MIQFLNNIEKADQGAKFSKGSDFLENLQIMEMNRITRRIHENDVDNIIIINQQLELQYAAAKRHGDLDLSVNGDYILD